ncbi:hypothetical protein MMC25_007673 [Agyrium rufum]|nr:hypothetical protein [Agyrium rufum]
MNGSYRSNGGGYDPRSMASSPGPSYDYASRDQSSNDLSVQSMKLKVLYTFDQESKTNCLARWPKALQIRTALLDEETQVGVVDLKTCMQAVVSASPELVARLGQDYTVYAFDYSEYDTPLVGQGMLSWVLASPSTNGQSQQSQAKTVVTGRVTNNLRGLFSNMAESTLEVKLRLVPVPTLTQNEFLESMSRYREMSKFMPEGFDAQEWTSFLQENPNILNALEQRRTQSPAVGTSQREMGIEQVQQLVRGNSFHQSNEAPSHRSFSRHNSFTNANVQQNQYRPASPATSVTSVTNQSRIRKPDSRTASRASHRGQPSTQSRRKSSVDMGYGSNEDLPGAPAKKRAKVTKTDWSGSDGFVQPTNSLRVAASTAASVRVFQPTAIRPGLVANSLEDAPRAPTPVAKASAANPRFLQPAGRSCLAREPSSMNSVYTSPYGSMDDSSRIPESAVTSPEDCRSISQCNTPAAAELNSSPPVLRQRTPSPSSPVLPALPNEFDSDFVNGPMDGLFDDEEDRPLDDLDFEMAAQYSCRESTFAEQPQTDLPEHPKSTAAEPIVIDGDHVEHHVQLGRADLASQGLHRTLSTGAFVPASDPVHPGTNALQRSQTWAGQMPNHPASDMPMGMDAVPQKRPMSRSGSGTKRKKQIQSKLATTIAAGGMPPFCDNCGEIETPTWRKGWARLQHGSSDHVKVAKDGGNGDIVGLQVLEKDTEGKTTLFKVFKKALIKEDEGFQAILLCNPCGLWLHQRKGLRPKKFWKRIQNRTEDHSKGTSPPENSSGGNHESSGGSNDGASQGSPHPSSPPTDGKRSNTRTSPRTRQDLPFLRPAPPNPGKELSQAGKSAREATDISISKYQEPSPRKRTAGGGRNVPIQVDDLTPNPTRRALFPSPKGSIGSRSEVLSEKDLNSLETTPRRSKRIALHVISEQENHSPLEDRSTIEDGENDELNHLFNDLPSHATTHEPSTPPQKSRSTFTTFPNSSPPSASIFKTPTKSVSRSTAHCSTGPSNASNQLTPGGFFSSAARAFLNPETPVRRSPRNHTTSAATTPSRASHRRGVTEVHNFGNFGEGGADHHATMTPFTTRLDALLRDAPGSGSGCGMLGEESPSRFLDFSALAEGMEREVGREGGMVAVQGQFGIEIKVEGDGEGS